MKSARIIGTLLLLLPATTIADEKAAAPDLMSQTPEQVAAKNQNCVSCHTQTDSATMHESDVPIACVDCHGGDPNAREKDLAHVLPKQKDVFATSANPVRSNTRILDE